MAKREWVCTGLYLQTGVTWNLIQGSNGQKRQDRGFHLAGTSSIFLFNISGSLACNQHWVRLSQKWFASHPCKHLCTPYSTACCNRPVGQYVTCRALHLCSRPLWQLGHGAGETVTCCERCVSSRCHCQGMQTDPSVLCLGCLCGRCNGAQSLAGLLPCRVHCSVNQYTSRTVCSCIDGAACMLQLLWWWC